MLHKADQPFLTDLVEERPDVGVQYPAHLSAIDPDTKRIQRVVRATSWPEPVRDSEEVLLVDRVQQCDHRPLDDLVLQGRDRERALPAVRLGYVDPPRRQCPIRSPLDSLVQVLELALKVRLVVRPPQSIHARRGILLEFVERFFEQVDADVVEERGEPLLLPFPCGAAISRKVQVPEAIAAQSVLAVAALASQAHADVMLPYGQTRPLSLFLVTV